ncbi:MAG: hypothetical protein ACMUIA_06630 [bacterium]
MPASAQEIDYKRLTTRDWLGMQMGFWKRNKRSLILWLILMAACALFLALDLNKQAIAAFALVYGLITHIFGAIFGVIGAWIGLIPGAGPLIIKVVAWPFFVLINAIVYLISLLRIRSDRPANHLTAQAIVTVLTTGILIGYLLSMVF